MTLPEIVAALAAWWAVYAQRVETHTLRLDDHERRLRRLERNREPPSTE